MSDGESTPRGTSRRAAAASKTSAKKTTARSEKKVVEKGSKKRNEEEQSGPSSDEDEVGTSSGRSTRKEKEKKKAAAPDSDDDVMIVKNVKAGPNAKKRPSPVKREPEDPEEQATGNSDAVQEMPTSSRSPARKEKQKETKASAKPSRRGPAAERAESGEEEVEEQEEEQMEERAAPARSTKKGGKKGRGDDDDDEEEEEAEVEKEKKKRGRKGKKAAEEDEDGEEGPTSSRQAASRSARKGKKANDFLVDSGEEEEEPAAAEREEEEEEVQEDEVEPAKKKRTASRSTSRKGRKAADSDDEDYEEQRPKRGRPPGRSTRKAKATMDESGDEEDEDVSPKKKAKTTKGKKDEGTSKSKARRALKKDLEAEELQSMIDAENAKKRKLIEERKKEKQRKEEEREKKREAKRKLLPPIETPKKKTQEERKAERDARRKERGEDDIEILDVKPLIPFKPQFVNDLPSAKREKSMTAPGDETEQEEDEIDDDEVHVEETVGVRTISDIMKPDELKACEAVVICVRNTLRSVFQSKDQRTFDNAVKNMSNVRNMAFDRKNYVKTSNAFYDEIENQLINMMMKDDKETKQETEAKKRVLKVIAKSSMQDFVSIFDFQYDAYWHQLSYFLNVFSTAEDPNIRANACFWMGNLLHYSKVCHKEEYANTSLDEMEELKSQRLAEEKSIEKTKAEREGIPFIDDGIERNDRRLLDEHALKMGARRTIYGAIYASLKHNDAIVRVAAIRAMSVTQDDPIPPAFEEAIRHSPKDLIMRQLMDVHVNVRRAAIEELRPSTAQQIEFLINAAMHEKHDFARKEAFAQLGRMRVGQFSYDQRHQLLAMLDDNVLGHWIEMKLLRPWLYEMITGENPRPIIIDGEDEEAKKKGRKKKAWTTAPFHLLAHLDCVNRSEDVLKVLKKASYIARKEIGLDNVEVSNWIVALIEGCDKESIALITQTDFNFLVLRETTDEQRAVSITFWLHCLKFITQYQKNEGDRFQAITDIAPSMGDLHGLILSILADEKTRIADRKKFINKGDFDVTHPCFIPTRTPLQSVVLMLLSAFRYLKKTEDTSSMDEWKSLLMTLSKGAHCDLSPPMWEVIMHDLLKFHSQGKGEDDVIYEMAEHMGFDYDDVVNRGTSRKSKKSPTKKGRASEGASSSTSPGRREEREKRIEDRRTLLSRPDFLGMVHGALKTALFKSSSESTGIVLTTELDLYRTFSDNNLHATCLECIGMFGWRSAEYAEKYFGFLMENLSKPPTNDKEWHDDEPMEVDGKKRGKKLNKVDQDALELQYQRRMKEELERKAAEKISKRGSRNFCVGQALAIISDLIIAHGLQKVDKWLKSCEEQYTLLDLFRHFEELAHDDDLELAFKVAHSMGKLAIHDRTLMKPLTRTAAKLQFRALHPSSFAHPLYRACVLDFFAHFGSLSTANQTALVDVVMTMLKILKDYRLAENALSRPLIDVGENATRAVALVVWSCAPTSLKKPSNGVRLKLTAHGSLLANLKLVLEKVQKDLREEKSLFEMREDKGRQAVTDYMNYYKALLGAMAGCEFYKQKASVMREMYDLLYSNADLLDPYDKGGEAKKKTQRITKTMDEHLDTLNEIIRQNKAIGVILTDDDALLPFKDEEEKLFEELEEKRRMMGKDLRDVSPVKDSRASRGYGRTPARKGRKEIMDRGVLSTLKKEPARSKSLQQTAAAERKEAAAAAAAASSQATPSRPTRSAMVRRPRAIKMTTIDEDLTDESE